MLETLALPVIIGIIEALKRAGLPAKYAVFPALALGVGMAFLLQPELDLSMKIVAGLTVGLAASGLYSGTRALLQQ